VRRALAICACVAVCLIGLWLLGVLEPFLYQVGLNVQPCYTIEFGGGTYCGEEAVALKALQSQNEHEAEEGEG
jgi:hypothetical protein